MTRRMLRIGLACSVGLYDGLVTGCETPTGPTNGTIVVTSATSGQPVDPDGYTIVVDQGAPEAIAANATVTISECRG